MKYLDPKADLTFKKVFGEHPDVVRSFLNALLPLPADAPIETIEYLPAELVPVTPLRKNSIVDVRCKDSQGRQFLVEMQMLWSPEFKQRVLFNASKAYVRQLDVKENYKLLQPVYSLNLVNEVFEPELPEYYHHYKVLHVEHSDRVIEGIQLVFVELPKFTPHTLTEKRMQVLWLRYLTEVNEKTRQVSQDLLAEPEIQKAVDLLEESAFSPAQLQGYDDFWDAVRVERTIREGAESYGYEKGMTKGLADGMAKGMEEGMAKGMEEGMAKGLADGLAKGMEEGMAKGELQRALAIARKMKQCGMSDQQIRELTGLSAEQMDRLTR